VTRPFVALRALLALALASASLSAQKSRAAEKPVWPDEGPATWTPRPTVAAITANDLRTRLYGLADDSMLGRRIGEPSNYKATEYIAREFKRLGLKPAGDNGTWFQDLAFGPVGYDSAASRLVIGSAVAVNVKDWIPTAPQPALGFSGKADLNGVSTVFAGRWGDTAVALDPAMFRGKVAVFIAAPTRGRRA